MIFNTIPSRDLLIDAYKFYSRGDARAHDALKIISERNDMPAAVSGCLDEAIKEEEQDRQNLYIQAAEFGKKYHPGIAIEEFQSTCRRLRVLNFCREIGIDPSLDIDSIVDRLLDRKDFKRAHWVVKWSKVDGEKKVITRLCESLINRPGIRDEQVAIRIQKFLGPNPIVPYADIANKAIEQGRNKLAIKLIEHEAQSSKQIPILLRIKQDDLVLTTALASCDSNLIYTAIFKLKESMASEIQFHELLRKHPLAFKYYSNYLAAADIQKLTMIAYLDGSRDELRLCLLDNRLENALTVCKATKQDFIAHRIEVHIKLNKFQQRLKQLDNPPLAHQNDWVGLSISDTIINLVAIGQAGKAKDCQRKYEVGDKKYKVLEQIALNILPKLSIPTINP